MANDYLSGHLREICEAFLSLDENDPYKIFGSPDYKKVKSSMTLFMFASGESDTIYEKVLDKFYDGQLDNRTLHMLNMDVRRAKRQQN